MRTWKRLPTSKDIRSRDCLHHSGSRDPRAFVVTGEEAASLLKALGQLRGEHCAHNSQLQLCRTTPHSLDVAVRSPGFSRSPLNHFGYDIGKVQYALNAVATQDAPLPKRVGRKSKIHDAACIDFVGKVLHKYANDSSKVVTEEEKKKKKTLVVAKVLSKNLGRTCKAEPSVRKDLSWSTFRAIQKKHFPHFRRPQRKTDT